MRTVRLVSLVCGGFSLAFWDCRSATPAISCAPGSSNFLRRHARCHDRGNSKSRALPMTGSITLYGLQKRIQHFFLHARQQRTEPI